MLSSHFETMAGESSALVRNARQLRADAEASAATIRRIAAALAQIEPKRHAAALRRMAEIVRNPPQPK